MANPVAKAKWVLETNAITGIPAESLKALAESEGIKSRYDIFPEDDWDGAFLWKGPKKIILINTRIGKTGRHNFTFAHELGHHFMEHPPSSVKNGQAGFHCILSDSEKESKPYETEADRFAAELLMPEDRFRFDMIGAEIDFALITGLSNRYMVSKQACSNRIVALTQAPCIIVRTKGASITGYSESRAARGFLKRIATVPDGTTASNAIENKRWQYSFEACQADKWLSRAIPGNVLYECTHISRESGKAMTILKW